VLRCVFGFPRVESYRMPQDRLTATFTTDSVLERTPELVGATITRNQGIVGEPVDLTVTYS
jgi:type III restriction enzyme